ncbi:T7SS effector LXG polymorphic toxin [Numidum massiliense]|uniref:T7SS effector LXG polymorphic toxin n=1 Tax=Numidum massiliense TaxID=1522315 RepID=UPI0006D56C22|nr:T7SS effector LXG polymorphic toxin [Numidum massiliense]
MKTLDVQALHNMLDMTEKTIAEQIGHVKAVEAAASEVVSLDDSLKGAAGLAIRTFFLECHLPFLKKYTLFLERYKSFLHSCKQALQSTEPEESGLIRDVFLEQDVKDSLHYVRTAVSDRTNNVNAALSQIRDILSLPNLDEDSARQKILQGQQKIEETLDKLHTFDHQQANALQQLEQDAHLMETYIARMNEMLQSGQLSVPGYSSGQWTKEETYQELFNSLPEKVKEAITEQTSKLSNMYGKGDNKQSPKTPDPINIASGNFFYEHTDLVIPGASPVALTRFYNAQDDQVGVFGANWQWNYGVHLKAVNDEDVEVTFADGHRQLFLTHEYGGFVAPNGSRHRLEAHEDGTYVLDTPSQECYTFDPAGQLTQVTDAAGRVTELLYNRVGQLVTLQTPCGTLQFTYNASGLITRVSDDAGRQVSYTYRQHDLVAFTDVAGQTIRYDYDENHRMTKVISPNGRGVVKNTYDDKGRATMQVAPNGGVTKLTYDEDAKRTVVKDAHGHETTYVYDERFRLVEKVNPLGEKERYTYNDYNDLVRYTDRRGYTTTYDYDREGNCIAMRDALGHVTKMTYTSQNKLASLTLADGATYTFSYDDSGNMIQEVNPLAHTATYSYTAIGQLKEAKLPNGARLVPTYDARGNLASLTNALQHAIHLTYDQLNRISALTDANGHTTHVAYDAEHRPVQWTGPDKHSVRYHYNAHGNVSKIVDQEGYETVFTYDESDQLVQVTDAAGNATRYTYDKLGHLQKVVDPNGNKTVYTYDVLERVRTVTDPDGYVTTYAYDANDNVVQVTDAEDGHTTYTYDALNRVVAMTQPSGAVTRYDYDAVGRLTRQIDSAGRVTTFTYDALGQLVKVSDSRGYATTYAYDALQKMTQMTLPNGHSWQFEYDLLGQLTKVVNPLGHMRERVYDPTGQVIADIDALGNKTTYVYDVAGRLCQVVNPDGSCKTFTYTSRGRIASLVDENGHTTQYAYDALNALHTVRDPSVRERMAAEFQNAPIDLEKWLTNREPEQTLTYQYNARGLIARTVDAAGQVTRYSYNGLGQLTSVVDRDGFETAYTYNRRQQVSGISFGDGREVRYEYNPSGQLTRLRDWLGVTEFAYDVGGQLAHVVDAAQRKTVYSWTPTGQRASVTYPDGYRVRYAYNALDQVVEVADDAERKTTYAYDANGQLQRRVLPNGHATTYAYDSLSRVTQLTHADRERRAYTSQAFTYDRAGNRMRTVATDQDGRQEETRYAYDELHRLTEVTHSDGLRRNYFYDQLGNRLGRIDVHEGKEGSLLRAGELYQYDRSNRLVQTFDLAHRETQRYSYDKRGNLVEIYRGDQLVQQHTFDAANRLVEAKTADGVQTHYAYNGLGQKVQRTSHSIVPREGDVATSQKGALQERAQTESACEVSESACEAPQSACEAATHHADVPVNGQVTSEGQNTESFVVDPLAATDDVLMTVGPDGVRRFIRGARGTAGADLIGEEVLAPGASSVAEAGTPDEGALALDGVLDAEKTFYYQHDTLGSATHVSSDRGDQVVQYAYDAFGMPTAAMNPIAETDTINSAKDDAADFYVKGNGAGDAEVGTSMSAMSASDGDFCFDAFAGPSVSASYTGHSFEAATGLYDAGARHYMPAIGRFISEDPWGGNAFHPQTTNPYPYVLNQPLKYVDATGRKPHIAVQPGAVSNTGSEFEKTLKKLFDPKHAAEDVKKLFPVDPHMFNEDIFIKDVRPPFSQIYEHIVKVDELGVSNQGAVAVGGVAPGPGAIIGSVLTIAVALGLMELGEPEIPGWDGTRRSGGARWEENVPENFEVHRVTIADLEDLYIFSMRPETKKMNDNLKNDLNERVVNYHKGPNKSDSEKQRQETKEMGSKRIQENDMPVIMSTGHMPKWFVNTNLTLHLVAANALWINPVLEGIARYLGKTSDSNWKGK